MKVEYLPGFLKDLKTLKSTPAFATIKALCFEEIPACNTLDEIRNFKKLAGYDDCYRVRVGDDRVGLIIEGDLLTFARVLHRREIYRYFP